MTCSKGVTQNDKIGFHGSQYVLCTIQKSMD